MPVVAAAGIGLAGSLIGARNQSKAASRATDAQSASAQAQLGLQREIYDDTSAKYKPYLTAGNTALQAYQSELGLGSAPKGYTGFQETPGYQFQFDQGTDAVNALAGAQGGLVSGRTLQDLTKFGQGLANQEYGNYLNRLAGMTDMGQAAAGNQASAGNAFAAQASNSLAAQGNAQAAGAIAQGNAFNNGLQGSIGAITSGINQWQYQNPNKSLLPGIDTGRLSLF